MRRLGVLATYVVWTIVALGVGTILVFWGIGLSRAGW